MKKIYLTLVALLATINMFAQGWPTNYSGVMLQDSTGIPSANPNGAS